MPDQLCRRLRVFLVKHAISLSCSIAASRSTFTQPMYTSQQSNIISQCTTGRSWRKQFESGQAITRNGGSAGPPPIIKKKKKKKKKCCLLAHSGDILRANNDIVAIITTFTQSAFINATNHYQIRTRKWSSFGQTNQTGSAGPANIIIEYCSY